MIGEITVDVHHLKIFFEACKEKSFTKAAKNLFISQSAVSIQIKKLETKLGIQLIERNSKNFRLTFAGKELYRMSKDVFDKILRVEKEMEKITETRENLNAEYEKAGKANNMEKLMEVQEKLDRLEEEEMEKIEEWDVKSGELDKMEL